jgi:hypothetical protein
MIVAGALLAPAARADQVESDWCGPYCGLIDGVLEGFNGLFAIAPIKPSDHPQSSDKASDRSGRDVARTDATAPTDKALGDGRDSAPAGRVDSRSGYLVPEGDSDPICLGCGGLPSPNDGPN